MRGESRETAGSDWAAGSQPLKWETAAGWRCPRLSDRAGRRQKIRGRAISPTSIRLCTAHGPVHPADGRRGARTRGTARSTDCTGRLKGLEEARGENVWVGVIRREEERHGDGGEWVCWEQGRACRRGGRNGAERGKRGVGGLRPGLIGRRRYWAGKRLGIGSVSMRPMRRGSRIGWVHARSDLQR